MAKDYVREISESAYEIGKILKIPPARLQRLGVYTIRIMMPPGASVYAVESPASIITSDQVEEDMWRVDFTTFDENNSGEIVAKGTQFSNTGHMFLHNTGPSRMPQFGERINMGYMLGDINGMPWMSDVDIEVPNDISGFGFDVEEVRKSLLVTSDR